MGNELYKNRDFVLLKLSWSPIVSIKIISKHIYAKGSKRDSKSYTTKLNET